MITRREFIARGGVTLALPLIGCSWIDKPISIAAHVWPGYETLFLARQEGWLDERRVRLVETSSATESLQALLSLQVEGASLTLDEVLRVRDHGMLVSVVMIFDLSTGADMLVARPDIKRLSDLKGRSIGFEQGAVGELMLAEALRTAGFSKKEVTLVSLPIDKHREAWEHRSVDACVTYEPVASELLAQGAIKLFDSRSIPNTIADVLAIRSSCLDFRYERAIRHAILGHYRALDHLARNPQDAAYRMARRLKLPADAVLSSFKGLVLPDSLSCYRLLTGTPPQLLESARKLAKTMVENRMLTREDDMSSLICADYLPPNAGRR